MSKVSLQGSLLYQVGNIHLVRHLGNMNSQGKFWVGICRWAQKKMKGMGLIWDGEEGTTISTITTNTNTTTIYNYTPFFFLFYPCLLHSCLLSSELALGDLQQRGTTHWFHKMCGAYTDPTLAPPPMVNWLTVWLIDWLIWCMFVCVDGWIDWLIGLNIFALMWGPCVLGRGTTAMALGWRNWRARCFNHVTPPSPPIHPLYTSSST